MAASRFRGTMGRVGPFRPWEFVHPTNGDSGVTNGGTCGPPGRIAGPETFWSPLILWFGPPFSAPVPRSLRRPAGGREAPHDKLVVPGVPRYQGSQLYVAHVPMHKSFRPLESGLGGGRIPTPGATRPLGRRGPPWRRADAAKFCLKGALGKGQSLKGNGGPDER